MIIVIVIIESSISYKWRWGRRKKLVSRVLMATAYNGIDKGRSREYVEAQGNILLRYLLNFPGLKTKFLSF
jgi:hypothetical protein